MTSTTTTTPSEPDGRGDVAGHVLDHVRVPAQILRRPAGSPRPVPAPRSPQQVTPQQETPHQDQVTGPDTPAGLPTSDVPGLYRPEPTGRTDPYAVGALIAGVLVPPLGVALGAVALVRIRRHAHDGRSLAVCGIVVGGLVSAILVLAVVLSALVSLGSSGEPSDPLGGSGGPGAVSQTCSGSICTVTARGAPVTVDGIGAGGADGVSVLSVGQGSATVASPEGPLEVPTGTALELGGGTQIVLTQASADTVVLVYQR